MKELIVISGKGGTGKTSLMAAFASLAENKVLCDADVDAADLHLIMSPEVIKQVDFQSGYAADIDKERCTKCSLSRENMIWNVLLTRPLFLKFQPWFASISSILIRS